MANALINALAETWNSGGTTFTAVKMDVTDTASAAGSLLMDLLVGSTSQFKVSKAGVVTAVGTFTGTRFITSSTPASSLPAFSGVQTWNDAGVTFKGISLAITNTTSAAGSLLMDLLVGGTSQFKVSKAGVVTSVGNMVTADAGSFVFGVRGAISATADGIFQMADTAGTAFTRLMFGGATSSFPALTRSTTALHAKLADNSAFAAFSAKTYTGTGGTITTSQPALDATQTWNDAAVTFKGISLAVTATASAGASLLMDLLVGGTSQFKVSKAGAVTALGAYTGTTAVFAAGTLTDASTGVDVTQTWNDAADSFKAVTVQVTNSASAAGARLVDLLVGGSSVFSVDVAGAVLAAAAGAYNFVGRGGMTASADGAFLFRDTAGTAVTGLKLGGTTSSFPMIKRSTTAVEIKLADDSVYTTLNAAGITAGKGTAITAGGSLLGHMFSSTASFGVFVGSGAPSISAAQGSLYLRSDGSSTSTRLYSNSDGAGTWVAVTTAS